MPLQVSRIIEECEDTRTLYFREEDQSARSFDFVAGQYISMRFDGLASKPLVRSYTIASCPMDAELAVTVKRVPNGIVSNYLCSEAKVGDVFKARGAMGRFCYDSDVDNPDLVLIGGGSGVTPFLAMVRDYLKPAPWSTRPKSIIFMFSYRDRQQIIGADVIEDAKNNSNISALNVLTRDNHPERGFLSGRISDSMLDTAVGHRYEGKTYMLCGPNSFMDSITRKLLNRGVADGAIKTESFDN